MGRPRQAHFCAYVSQEQTCGREARISTTIISAQQKQIECSFAREIQYSTGKPNSPKATPRGDSRDNYDKSGR